MEQVLYIEDELIIAEPIITAIENDSYNFKVTWVATATAGLEALDTGNFDFVLLDLVLPDESGFDVLRKIRINPRIAEIPVIITTSRTDEIDIVLGLEGHGADDYVTKPLSPRELIARMKTVLRRSRKQSMANVSIFTINKSMAQIQYKDQTIAFTKAECALFKFLLENPNQAFSKDELLDAIWEKPHSSDPDTITTHIKAIRQKLEDVGADKDCIQTHRGLGYSLKLWNLPDSQLA